MAYRVQYNQSESACRDNGNGSCVLLCLLTLVLVACVVLYCSNDSVRSMIQDLLIPGDDAVTKAAFVNMIGQLQNGDSVSDSLTTFCYEILEASGFAANR